MAAKKTTKRTPKRKPKGSRPKGGRRPKGGPDGGTPFKEIKLPPMWVEVKGPRKKKRPSRTKTRPSAKRALVKFRKRIKNP